jgi:hypothetical protein
MAILAVAALASDFGGTATSTTTATGRDAAYSPSNIDIPVSSETSTFLALDRIDVAASGVVWVHFRLRWGDTVDAQAGGNLFTARDAGGNAVAKIDMVNQQVSAVAFGDSTETGVYNTVTSNQEVTYDLMIDRSGATTIVSLYKDGSNFPESTAEAANFVGYGVPRDLIWEFDDVTNASSTMYMNEVIVTDGEDTRLWRLATLEPDTNGTYNAWTGDVTELGDLDPLTVATADTDGLQQSWNPSAYGGTVGPLRAVCVGGRVKRGLVGLSQVEQFIRVGGTDYPGTVQGPASGGGSLTVLDVWDTNPATLAPWASSALATIEGGVTAKT